MAIRIAANNSKLIRLFQNFTDAINRRDIRRVPYEEYKFIRMWLQQSTCAECGDADYYELSPDGVLECPDCGCIFDPNDYSGYLATGLQNIYRDIHAQNMEDIKVKISPKDPNSGMKLNINKDGVKVERVKVEGGNDMFNMNGMFKNLQFGAVKGDAFRLSPKGIAFKTKDGYVSYDSNAGEVTDVTGMTFDMENAVFAMPVSQSKVAVDDIIIHAGNPVVVKEVKAKTLVVVYPFAQEVKEIIPTKSMFGFNFYTKISPLFDMGGADEESPFGNMLPFMMMNGSNGGDMNPMMLMMLMGDKKDSGFDKESMMMMAMMNGNGNNNGNGNMLNMMLMSKMLK